MKKLAWMGLSLSLVLILSGCSTIKGMGEDIRSIGGWISNGSDHVRENVGKNK
ncbi:MAG: entericidin EcnA/B family protein [Candidatus Omnitrophica bacterium]|nr:entericidin EcnA/B family protein [Candidatus Omnitrophota bacterium]